MASGHLRSFGLIVLGSVIGVLTYHFYTESTVLLPESVPGESVAIVGERHISAEQFYQNMVVRGGKFVGQFDTIEQKKTLLNEMVTRELQIIRAEQAGYLGDPEVIARKERALVARLRDDQLSPALSSVSVNDDEVDAYYEQHLARYTTPAKSRIAAIQLAMPSGASVKKRAEKRALAEEILALTIELPDSVRGFGALAARYSDHQASRYAGGDVGWFVAGQGGRIADKAVIEQVVGLQMPGKTSPVIEGEDGLYLLRLIETKPEQIRPLSEVEPRIRRILLAEKQHEAKQAWLNSLRGDDLPIEINHSLLESIEPPQGTVQRSKEALPAGLPNG